MFGFLKRDKAYTDDDLSHTLWRRVYEKDKEIKDLKEKLRKSDLEKEKLNLQKKYALKSLIDEDMTGYVKFGDKLLLVKVESAEKYWGPKGFDFKEMNLECTGEEYA